MILKKFGVPFILGASICKYFDDKIYKMKDCKIENRNITIDIMDRWLTLHDKGISIERYLKDKNYKKVAIYGLGMLGNHLYEELKKAQVDIIGIDRADIHDNFQMPIYKPYDCFGDVDIIIVTPLSYDAIFQQLRENYEGSIISLWQLLSECETYLY